jgi:hypothetical protein
LHVNSSSINIDLLGVKVNLTLDLGRRIVAPNVLEQAGLHGSVQTALDLDTKY